MPATQAREELAAVDWRKAIRQCATSIAISWTTRSSWMHRRVDKHEFLDAEATHRRISLDITTPETSPTVRARRRWSRPFGLMVTGYNESPIRIIPLMRFKKDYIFLNFSMADETGAALPHIRESDSRLLGGEILTAIAEGIIEHRLPSLPDEPDIGDERKERNLAYVLTKISSTDAGTATRAYNWESLARKVWDGLSDRDHRKLFSSDEPSHLQLKKWVSLLSEDYLFCGAIPGRPGQSRIIKLSYDAKYKIDKPKNIISKARSAIGWKDWNISVELPLADAASYHGEVRVPPGISIRTQDTPEPNTDREGEEPTTSTIDLRFERTSSCSYFTVAHQPECDRYELGTDLRVRPGGWLISSFFSSAAVMTLLFLSWLRFSAFTKPAPNGAPGTDVPFFAGTLFLAGAAAMIAVLIRTNEHELTALVLRSLRCLASVMVIACFCAALLLVFWVHSGHAETIFFWSWIVAAIPTIAIGGAVLHGHRR